MVGSHGLWEFVSKHEGPEYRHPTSRALVTRTPKTWHPIFRYVIWGGTFLGVLAPFKGASRA